MRPVLVTRSEPGATRTIARLNDRGIAAVNAATARIAFHPDAPDFSGIACLAFTSPNGVTAFTGAVSRRDLPVMAVGAVTAAKARAEGFEDVTSADGDGAALARLIASAPPDGPVLHVTGADRGFDLAAALVSQGVKARTAVLYEAVETGPLDAEAVEALKAGGLILVHSPLGAARFAGKIAEAGLAGALARCDVAAMSAKAGAPLKQAGARRVLSAETPDEDALFLLLDRMEARRAR